MKVAVDARMYNMSGIGIYLQYLIKNNCYNVALGNEEELKDIKNLDKVIDFKSPIYGINEQLKFPYKKLKKENVDVLHVPHYNIPIFYRGDMVVTIHDLTHIVYSELFGSKLKTLYAKFMMKTACRKAKVIITGSEYAKQDIIKHLKADESKIRVIYHGVKENMKEKTKEEVDYLYEKFNIPRGKKLLMFCRKFETT